MKLLRLFSALFVILINFQSAFAAVEVSVTDLQVNDSRTIVIELDEEIDTSILESNDIKIMHDIMLESPEIDLDDSKRITVELKTPLDRNTIYNLISISGVDGSMDFETEASLDNEEIMNTKDEGIKSITILNPNVLEVYYYEPIEENEVELKLLRDMSIDTITSESESESEFIVSPVAKLLPSNNYIFMLLSAIGPEGDDAEISNGIFDFSTGGSLEDPEEEEKVPDLNSAEDSNNSSDDASNSTNEQQSQEETNTSENQTQQETVVDNSQTVNQNQASQNGNGIVDAPADTGSQVTKAGGNGIVDAPSNTGEQMTKAGTSNIEEVAAGAEEVPTAGAATNILILLALITTCTIAFKTRRRY